VAARGHHVAHAHSPRPRVRSPSIPRARRPRRAATTSR
jgi:hypothetical protein